MTNSSSTNFPPVSKRLESFPSELDLALEPKMRIPTTLKYVRLLLKVSQLLPGLTHRLCYKLFFRINSKARADKPSGLASLFPDEYWITLITHDGSANKQICCYEIGDPSAPTVVLIHGWESRVDQMFSIAEALLEKGFRVLCFDLPAHGRSQGKHTDLLEINAIVCAMLQGASSANANNNVQAKTVKCEAVVAHSFGGVCAAKLLSSGLSCRSLVLISTPSSFVGVFNKFSYLLGLNSHTPSKLKKRISDRFKMITSNVWDNFSTNDNLASLNQNVLITHDIKDKVVPIQEGKLLFDTSQRRESHSKQQVLVTNGLGHNRILADETVAAEVASFINEQFSSAQSVWES